MSMKTIRGTHGTASEYDRFLQYDEAPKTAVYRDFSGGLLTREDAVRTDTAAVLMNMEAEGGILFSAAAPSAVAFAGGFVDGTVTDGLYADGIFLFRKGRTLYALKNDEIVLVGERDMLKADSGAIYHFDEHFCVVDEEAIYFVDHELNAEKAVPRVPTVFTGLSRDGLTYTASEPFNPFSRYFEVVLSDEDSSIQKIPAEWAIDTNYLVLYTKSGAQTQAGSFSFDGTTLRIFGYNSDGLRVRLKLADSDDETKLRFSDTEALRTLLREPNAVMKLLLSDGTTLLLTYKDKELIGIKMAGADGFYDFNETKILRSPCAETVTGLVAYSEGYLIFFENSVKKLSVTEDEETGEIVFHISPFKNDIGSDMSGSICGFDDKIIFASSKGGVYYIDKFGITEREVTRTISANIEGGEDGFFSHGREDYETAAGFCAFGKYYLTVGDFTYIWDYRAKLPTSAQSGEDEAKMIWSMSDAVRASRYLLCLSGKLYYTDKATGELFCLCRNSGKTEASLSKMQTQALDLGAAGKKTLISLGVCYRAGASVRVRLCCDGTFCAGEYLLPRSESIQTIFLKIPARRAERFSAELSCDGYLTAERLIFQYIL